MFAVEPADDSKWLCRGLGVLELRGTVSGYALLVVHGRPTTAGCAKRPKELGKNTFHLDIPNEALLSLEGRSDGCWGPCLKGLLSLRVCFGP